MPGDCGRHRGSHEFDAGLERLLLHQDRAHFPFLGANIVDESTLENPDWVQGIQVFTYGRLRIGVIGIALERTPEFVSAGATAGLAFLPAIETIRAESARLRRKGVKIQIVLINGAVSPAGTPQRNAAVPGTARSRLCRRASDTTVDVILAARRTASPI
jgi:2',3'-cyclic-nucleotide 2'-phosphodiesterase (5'-nucleotidase family)